MPRIIEGRTAFVTGANRGIGLALTRELLNRGAAKIYAGARQPGSLEALAHEFGERLVPVQLDVTSEQQVVDAAAAAPDVDLLINNAGVVDWDNPMFVGGDWIQAGQQEMAVNVFGTYRMTDAFVPILRANGRGTIVNVLSAAAFAPLPALPSYSVSKAALHSLTQVSRMVLAKDAIEVLGVYPGPVDTDMGRPAPFAKALPADVATAIVSGIEAGTEDILPDAGAEQAGSLYASGPKRLEQLVTGLA